MESRTEEWKKCKQTAKEEKDQTKIVIIYVSILKSRALWKTEADKEFVRFTQHQMLKVHVKK